MNKNSISSLELCAEDGGQVLGLELADFGHDGLVEIERHCCNTLRLNRPEWQIFEKDLRDFVEYDAKAFNGLESRPAASPAAKAFQASRIESKAPANGGGFVSSLKVR